MTQPTFQRQQIERYAAVMVEHTERMLESWHDGQVRDPHEDMAHLTLSIVAKTLFGTDLAGEADVVGESLEVVDLGPRRTRDDRTCLILYVLPARPVA